MEDQDTKVGPRGGGRMVRSATIVVHSGDIDKLMSALIIGNGALAMGADVTLFFTFWGLERLKKNGLEKAPLSRMNLLGLGAWMIRRKMKAAGVVSARRLMEDFKDLGGRVLACEMTMSVMGVKTRDLDEALIDDYVGVGVYLESAAKSDLNLFI